MKTSTHLRLANLVALELGLKLDSEECAYLRGGSIEPDKWKDYPHHFAVDYKLKNALLKSRRHFLDGNTKAHLEWLGIAFHYTADKWTLFSGSAVQHANWEDQIDKCKMTQSLNQILVENLSTHQELLQQYLAISEKLLTASRGKDRTLSLAFQNRPTENGTSYSTPEIDFNLAFRVCLTLALSVRSMTTPPNELMKALNLLTPWTSSQELSNRAPPVELEAFFRELISRCQPLENEISNRQEELKKKQSNFISTFIFRQRIKSSIRHIKRQIKSEDKAFKTPLNNFINEYQPHIDWYYWGTIDSPTIRKLTDLFESDNNYSRMERANIDARIKAHTFNELIELKRQGYQLVRPGINFTINAVFGNPTNKVVNLAFYVYAPDNCKVECPPKEFRVEPKRSLTHQVRVRIPSANKLASYLVEWAFLLISINTPEPSVPQRFLSYEKWGEYETKPAEGSAYTEITEPALPFAANHSYFVKLVSVTEKIRKEWAQKSIEGAFCGAIGCDNKQPDWVCPKCKLHFCNNHKNHVDCEELSKL